MTCSSCVARVRNELNKFAGVSAKVQLSFPQATITMAHHLGLEELQAAVSNAGPYTISFYNGQSLPDITDTGVEKGKKSYLPLILIFGYIAGVSILVQMVKGSFNWMQWMTHFMAGFFFVFSFFKLMNLRGFAEGYGTYDLVARKVPLWGYIYPFIELGLGIVLLLGIIPLTVNALILLVMGVSGMGVIQSLLKKRKFQCACLGTVIQLPLSWITLAEDLLMMGMSGTMIVLML